MSDTFKDGREAKQHQMTTQAQDPGWPRTRPAHEEALDRLDARIAEDHAARLFLTGSPWSDSEMAQVLERLT